jgi:hypothetical protein
MPETMKASARASDGMRTLEGMKNNIQPRTGSAEQALECVQLSDEHTHDNGPRKPGHGASSTALRENDGRCILDTRALSLGCAIAMRLTHLSTPVWQTGAGYLVAESGCPAEHPDSLSLNVVL